MKVFAIVALTAGLFSQTNAHEPIAVSSISLALSKDEITAILDHKTKMHLDIAPLIIEPLIVPTELVLIARRDKAARQKEIMPKTLGDE